MTQAKLNLNDLVIPVFTDEQLNYIEGLAKIYREDMSRVNPLQYNPAPVWSQLHVHLTSLASFADAYEFLVAKARESAEELLEDVKLEAKVNLGVTKAPLPEDPHRTSPI